MKRIFLIGFSVGFLTMAADAPYLGNWKMNATKSNFGEMTVSYESLSAGEMKVMADGQSWTFKTDGKDYATPWGMTQAWTAAGDRGWGITEKTNGKVSATSTAKISADGKTMTVESKRVKADGGTSDETVTFQRVSGSTGLAGKWKTQKMTASSPETLSLTAKGTDGLTIMIGNEGAKCEAKYDGKDNPANGTLFPAGWTCAVAKNGPQAFDLTWKKEGKPMYKSTFTASADGKTLTETGSAVGVNEKYSMVYDRQ